MWRTAELKNDGLDFCRSIDDRFDSLVEGASRSVFWTAARMAEKAPGFNPANQAAYLEGL